MSAYNYEAMYGTVSDDFQLLENGEIWDMAKLVEAVKTDEGILERRNFFSVIKTAQNGESVWISYWNRADIKTTQGETDSVAWLESVVVVKEDGEWKLQMMHSTGIRGAKNLPEGLEMEEYIGVDAFIIAD